MTAVLTDPIIEAVPIPVDDPRSVLLRAAEYMRTHGKCAVSLQASDGRVCALGAIAMIEYGDAEPGREEDLEGHPALAILWQEIERCGGADWGGSRHMSVAFYSDQNSTAEVIDTMIAAANTP